MPGEASITDEWLTFVNRVTAEVRRDFPGVYIATNGYANRNLPPEGVQLDDHTVIMFAAIWSCTLHGYDDDHCWQKVQQGQMLRRWCELCKNVWIYGYNYQAHLFNSYYCNVYLGGYDLPPYEGDDALYLETYGQAIYDFAVNTWCWPYRNVVVNMKWNDAWLAHMDCDGDGKLDRHFGYPSYIGSGAWETNHQSGTNVYDGVEYRWNYFVKIVAAPSDATLINGIWYDASGVEIGPVIWNEFAIIEEVYNDQYTGEHGLVFKSPVRAGLGDWEY